MIYSEEFKDIIAKAKKIANKRIVPEDLFVGILLSEHSFAYNIISKILDINIYKNLYKHKLYIDNNNIEKITIDNSAENILNQAQLEAKKNNTETVGSEHLLLALCRASFFNNDIKYNDVEKILNNTYKDMNAEYEDKNEGQNSQKPAVKTGTPTLDQFSVDLTKLAKEDKLDPVIGRQKEIRRITQVLSRRRKNNPVILGDSGIGKTAVVELLAQMIVKKTTPECLYNKRILALEMGSIVAGTKYRGEFEERMKKIIDELKQNPDIIVYLDELHTLVGAGGASGALDAANIIKPALSRGEISFIGSTTNEEYKNIEKDKALARRFQKVQLYEPTKEETLQILHQLKPKYEEFHLIKYTDDAIDMCLKLSERYLTDRKFPDKAIDVLDEAGSSAKINFETPKELIEKEKELNDIINLKFKSVEDQDFEGAAKYKKTQDNLQIELDKYKETIKQLRLSNKKLVTADNIADVISTMTGIPSKNLTDDESNKLVSLKDNLKANIVGQDEAIDVITRTIFRNKAGLSSNTKPQGVFLFMGPSGVGKTHIAKSLAKELFNNERDMIRIDMSEYMEKHSVARLIGAPPGYVGHEDGGQLTEAVRKKPYAIILLDEIEKAHSDVYNVLLQVFDDGIMTDSLGKTVDFRNTIIIMTSNVGSREVKARGAGIGFSTDESAFSKDVVDKELKKKFAPEFLNRIDEIISFNALTKDDIKGIIQIELNKLNVKLIENDIFLTVDDSVKDFLFEKGYDANFGARPLKRAIQKFIEDEISIKLITKEIKKGDRIKCMKSIDGSKLEFINEINIDQIGCEDIKMLE